MANSPHGGADSVLSTMVHRIARGDQVAFAAMYEGLSGEVRDRVGARLSDLQQVEFVVSATFLEVWRLSRFHAEPAGDVRAWVYAVVDARVYESLRLSRDVAAPGSAAAKRGWWWAGFAGVHDSRREHEFRAVLARPG